MSHIKIRGGHSLHGEIEVQGAKNAALPIIAASVLNNGTVRLRRCPQIMDVHHMLRILQQSGARIMWDDGDVWVKTDQMDTVAVSSLDAGKMRSSIILLGALLGRGQEVTMPYPGGCTIGARPIDWHIDALRKMNVQIDLKENKIECKTTGLKGNRIELPYPSVGVTENILLAAVLADGVTEIIHAAMEPEIADLCRFLKKSGACIEGEGTERIWIKGVKTLHDTEYTIMADRIAAGTYMGGWRVIRTLGKGLTEISTPQGFAAEAASATTILVSSHLGFALSTTQVCSGSIIGTGLGKKGNPVNWGVAGRMLIAWLVTFPAAGIVGALACALAKTGVWGTVATVAIAVFVALIIFRLSKRNPVNSGNVNDSHKVKIAAEKPHAVQPQAQAA